HVSDARALAQKYQADKNVWSGNVERYLQLKRLQLYYEDPVCQFGYFRSDETVNYVKNVMAQWQSYKEKTDDSAPRIKK
ncbi:MAG TPA: lytic transglycosylase F, partial [Porphyromonadaceae bacterium]|nr:lytic transglycosylase F [Porphyromonadaceae bacterium]